MINAHCSDEVSSDSKTVRWIPGQKKLTWRTKRLKAACLCQITVYLSNLIVQKLHGSQRKSNGNDNHREVDKKRDQANNTIQKRHLDCLRNAMDLFCCCSHLKLFFINKCAYPKVRETIAWYLLCFWSTYVQEQHWNEHNAIACCQKFNQDVLPTFCWCSADLLLNS